MPERALVSGAVFLILGILLGERFPFFPVTVSLVILSAGLILYRLNKRSRKETRLSLGDLLFLSSIFFFGFFYIQWKVIVPQNDISQFADGSRVAIIGRVEEPPLFFPNRLVTRVEVRQMDYLKENVGNTSETWRPVTGSVRLSVYQSGAALSYGDLIRFEGRLKKIRSFQNPGGFDYATYLSRQGIRASINVSRIEAITRIGEEANPVSKKINLWRETIRLAIESSLSPRSAALLKAMVIGSTEGLTPEIRDTFMNAGVTHILSISGSHLGVLALLVFSAARLLILILPGTALLRLSGFLLPTQIAALLTMPVVVFYTFLAGGEIATVRSLIMILIYLTALLLERDGSGMHSLAMATGGTLLHDPRALFQISFQLSYIAVLALCVVARREEGNGLPSHKSFHSRFIRKLRLYGFLTISVFWVTTPLVAAYFNQLGWVGLVSNSVVIPYIGAVVVPLGILSSVSALWRSQGDLLMGDLNEFSVNLAFWIVHFFSTFPGSEIHLASPSPCMIFCFYGLTLLVFFRKALKDRLIRLSGIMILGSFLMIGIVSGTVREKPLIQVTFLDVGQGDAAVLQLADQVVVIDGGGTFSETFDIGRSVVAPYLWDQGIHRIDLMIATHPQMDHMKGLFYLSDHFDVIEAWGNGDEDETLLGRRFKNYLRERGISYSAVFRDHQGHDRGPCRIDVLNPLHPKGPEHQETATKLNDRSIVLRVSCNRLAFLFTGDIEQRGIDSLLESGQPLESTVLKVPHHGSKGSADPDWVSSVCPQLAVFSVGYQNVYRHPAPEALEAYEAVKAQTHRTDLSGALTIQSDGYKLRYRSAVEMLEKPVSWSRPDLMIFQEIENLRKRWEGVS